MLGKRKRQQRKQYSVRLVLGKVQTEETKGCDKTMLQKKTVYRQKVKDK